VGEKRAKEKDKTFEKVRIKLLKRVSRAFKKEPFHGGFSFTKQKALHHEKTRKKCHQRTARQGNTICLLIEGLGSLR